MKWMYSEVRDRCFFKCIHIPIYLRYNETQAGASIDQRSNENDTALIWASLDGHLECVKWLVSIGANLNDTV
jgi:hypothetical protein